MSLSRTETLFLNLVREDFTDKGKNFGDIDWEFLFDLACRNRLFPLVYQAIKMYIPESHKELFHNESVRLTSKIDRLVHELKRLDEFSKEERIRFVLVKGLVLSKVIYEDIYLRQINDIDILVEEDDTLRMDYILRKMNYIQPYENIDNDQEPLKLLPYPIMRLKHTNHFFEYYNFRDEIVSKIELHKRLYFVNDENILDFIWNTQRINIAGHEYNSFNNEFLILFMFLNAYQNSETLYSAQGTTIIRDYVDLYRYLVTKAIKVEWSMIKKLAKKYRVENHISLVLHNLFVIYQTEDVDRLLKSWKKDIDLADDDKSINWESNLIHRIFHEENRKAEIKKIQKINAFSHEQDILHISSDNKMEGFGEVENYIHYENRYNIDIRYFITYTNTALKIYLYIPHSMYTNIENYLFQISVYNSDLENEILYSILEVLTEDKMLTAKSLNTPILRDANVLRKQSRGEFQSCSITTLETGAIIAAELPFSFMKIDETSKKADKAIFAYRFNLFKFMYKDTYHLVNDDPQEHYTSRILILN